MSAVFVNNLEFLLLLKISSLNKRIFASGIFLSLISYSMNALFFCSCTYHGVFMRNKLNCRVLLLFSGSFSFLYLSRGVFSKNLIKSFLISIRHCFVSIFYLWLRFLGQKWSPWFRCRKRFSWCDFSFWYLYFFL